jgi:hypothetical protein
MPPGDGAASEQAAYDPSVDQAVQPLPSAPPTSPARLPPTAPRCRRTSTPSSSGKSPSWAPTAGSSPCWKPASPRTWPPCSTSSSAASTWTTSTSPRPPSNTPAGWPNAASPWPRCCGPTASARPGSNAGACTNSHSKPTTHRSSAPLGSASPRPPPPTSTKCRKSSWPPTKPRRRTGSVTSARPEQPASGPCCKATRSTSIPPKPSWATASGSTMSAWCAGSATPMRAAVRSRGWNTRPRTWQARRSARGGRSLFPKTSPAPGPGCRSVPASAVDTRPTCGGHRGRGRTPGWTVLRTGRL